MVLFRFFSELRMSGIFWAKCSNMSQLQLTAAFCKATSSCTSGPRLGVWPRGNKVGSGDVRLSRDFHLMETNKPRKVKTSNYLAIWIKSITF